MNIKHAILALLFVPSIMTARQLSRVEMTEELIAAKENDLEITFKKFDGEQDKWELSCALTNMTIKKENMSKAVRCLEMTKDHFPNDESNVNWPVHKTVFDISNATEEDTEAFANVVASFRPSAIKTFATIRYGTLWREDARNVLEQVMKKSPELITGSLPRWLASHGFDQNSRFYNNHESPRKQALEYLASLATESDLSKALDIAKKNVHFKVDSIVHCCWSEDSYPGDLISSLEAFLRFVKGRKELLGDIASLPTVLIDLVESYLRGSMNSLSTKHSKDRAPQNILALEYSSPVPNPIATKTLGKRRRDN